MSFNMDKLAQAIAEKSGYTRQHLISEEAFKKFLFPNELLGKYLWQYYSSNDPGARVIGEDAFVSCSEKIFGAIADKDQVQFYLKVFSGSADTMGQRSFQDLVQCAFVMYGILEKLEQDELDTSSPPALQWLDTVNQAAYHGKQEMSISFLLNWILANAPRLLAPLHKYVTTQLTTSCREMISGAKEKSKVLASSETDLDKEATNDDVDHCKILIHPILMWLLRSSLPYIFLQIMDPKYWNPQPEQGPSARRPTIDEFLRMQHPRNTTEKWSLLYDSEDQGLSVNRFQHHVYDYNGPTLLFVKGENNYLFCVALDSGWSESCHFWGGEDCVLYMLKPEFKVVERGSKIAYANFSIRGYPLGIQVGKNPKNLSLEIKSDFSYISFKQMPIKLIRFLAWGCAPKRIEMSQKSLRKWEEQEAEKNKKINLNNPEWTDNPDKYLLELAGNYRSYESK